MVGEDLLDYVKTLQARLDYLGQHAQFWTLETPTGPQKVIFLPRANPPLDEPSMGLEAFIARRGLTEEIVGMVYPDRRGTGYGLSRFEDKPALDFSRIADAPEVHFAHARGFIAKTSATDIETLQNLLLRSAAKPAGDLGQIGSTNSFAPPRKK